MISKNRFHVLSDSQANGERPGGRASVGRSFRDLTQDALRLTELQVTLAKREAGEGLRGLILPIAILISAAVVGLGAVPVVLLTGAMALVEFAKFDQTAAYAIAAGVGLILAIVLGLAGRAVLRQRLVLFERSTEEFRRNVQWLKQIVGNEDDHVRN